ncbi:hypothetical protein V5O48_013295 [Marasmius crinis-equi]|uniref:Uncharacterized protein n=1 Tax=Marasmius crinis-equi TaxID=585013 RepID=A0ABR3F0G2_9AGAR
MPRKKKYATQAERRAAAAQYSKTYRDKNLNLLKERREAKVEAEELERMRALQRKKQQFKQRRRESKADGEVQESSSTSRAPKCTSSGHKRQGKPEKANGDDQYSSSSSQAFKESSSELQKAREIFDQYSALVNDAKLYLEDLFIEVQRDQDLAELQHKSDTIQNFHKSLDAIALQVRLNDGMSDEWRQIAILEREIYRTVTWMDDLYSYASVSFFDLDEAYDTRTLLYQRNYSVFEQ